MNCHTSKLGCWLLAWLVVVPTTIRADSVVQTPPPVIVRTVPSAFWGYNSNPYAGILHGVADLTRATGEKKIMEQEAEKLRLEVREKKLAVRRSELESWEWERNFTMGGLNRYLEESKKNTETRSLNDPPVTEILAAQSHNTIFNKLMKLDLSTGTSIPVDQEGLPHIHVTCPGGPGGNVGLLKEEKLPWPRSLLRPQFRAYREQIDSLLKDAKFRLLNRNSAHEQLDDLEQAVKQMNVALHAVLRGASHDSEWSPRASVSALTFLDELKESIKALDQKDKEVLFYLQTVQGKTVAELVQYMKTNGLSFAPATNGCERHYISLYRALASEAQRLQFSPD